LPGESRPCSFRLKLDSPPLEAATGKPALKYLSRAGTGNRLYFVPGVDPTELTDTSLPVVITEGEKKTLALCRLAVHEAETARWLPIGIAGVWSWRGTAGKADSSNGKRVDVKGPIADLALIQWQGRQAYLVFDSDVLTNNKVRSARQALATELKKRGADVWLVTIAATAQEDKIGVDDFIFRDGPEAALRLFEQAQRAFEVPVEQWLKESGLLDLAAPVDVTKLEGVLAWIHGHVGELASFRRSLAKSTIIEQLKKLKVSGAAGIVASVFGHESKDEESGNGKTIAFAEVLPAAEPVDGAALLDEIVDVLRRYIVMPDGSPEAVALWVVLTYLTDAAEILPILGITSPDKRCGKSLLLDILAGIVHRHIPASNISPAALFRAIEGYRPTLLIDEADCFLEDNEELRGILNAGHRRSSAYVLRCVGDDSEPRQFSTWGPKALAKIGTLPATLDDRAITIKMKRKSPAEIVNRYAERRESDRLAELRRRCVRWALDYAAAIREADPADLPELHDRANDNWRPLLAIADTAAGAWPERARESARLLSGAHDDDTQPARVQALIDIRELFEREHTDRLSSAEIVKALGVMEERPWPEWKGGKPITQKQLASLLRPFGVRPRLHKIGSQPTRCYSLPDFTDAFLRYTPAEESLPPLPSASSAAFQPKTQSLPGGIGNDSKIAEDPRPMGKVTMVTDRQGDIGLFEEVEGLI
jgi:hypothetical protein